MAFATNGNNDGNASFVGFLTNLQQSLSEHHEGALLLVNSRVEAARRHDQELATLREEIRVLRMQLVHTPARHGPETMAGTGEAGPSWQDGHGKIGNPLPLSSSSTPHDSPTRNRSEPSDDGNRRSGLATGFAGTGAGAVSVDAALHTSGGASSSGHASATGVPPPPAASSKFKATRGTSPLPGAVSDDDIEEVKFVQAPSAEPETFNSVLPLAQSGTSSQGSTDGSPKDRAARNSPSKPGFRIQSTRERISGRFGGSALVDLEGIALCDDPHRKETTVATAGDGGQFNYRHMNTRMGAAVFADADQMKQKVRQAIGKPEYSVTLYYKDTGIFQKIARSHLFDHFTLFVIACNAIWISIDTDYNHADVWTQANPVFQVAENFFCLYFCFEWIVRFLSFRYKADCVKDSWMLFDSVLVCLMVLETWVLALIVSILIGGSKDSSGVANMETLRLIRLLRLSRMARLARLLRATPELMIIIKGMVVAMRSVLTTLLLLILIVYVFAIAFRQMGKDTALESLGFRTVGEAMVTLLLQGTHPDLYDFVVSLISMDVLLSLTFVFFVFLASLTVMNMLVGVLVEVVHVVSSVEKEQLEVSYVKASLEKMIAQSGIDENGDNLISKEEFKLLIEKPEAARALQNIGCDAVGLVDFSDFIFVEDKPISFGDFMETVLQLRGSNTSTVKDMVDLRKFIVMELYNMERSIEEKLDELHAPKETCVRGTHVDNTLKRVKESMSSVMYSSGRRDSAS